MHASACAAMACSMSESDEVIGQDVGAGSRGLSSLAMRYIDMCCVADNKAFSLVESNFAEVRSITTRRIQR